jgi:hypothetical protein
MITKMNLKPNWEKISTTLKSIGRATIIIVSIAVGFIGGEIYHNYQTHTRNLSMQESKTPEQTSVAINERGELMIINRQRGTYTLYDKQVGNMIFSLYANKIYQTKTGN